jgi:predicted TIM-barrel fold metal-dependent hydrolase
MMQRRTFIASALATAGAASLPEMGFSKGLAPFKMFDTHAHFYTNQPDKYPFQATGARYGAEKMIAKATARPMTPEAVFAFWDQIGVERGTGVQYNSTYGTDNSYLLDMSNQHPKRIIPVVILSPTDAKTPATLQQWAKGNHLAGVRFTGAPNAQGEVAYLSDASRDTWAAANELGITIVLMPLGTQIPLALTKVADFAERYPNVKIAMDHIGFPRPELLPETFGLTPEHMALAAHKNVYYKYTSFLISEMEGGAKTAGKPMVDLKPFLQHMVGVFGADHLMWGSDYGNVEVDDLEYVKRALASAEGLKTREKKALFYDTARSVFVPGGRGMARA